MFFTPTYKRPERLKNFIDAYIRTGATEPVEVTIQGHHELYKNIEFPETFKVVWLNDNIGLIAALNQAFERNPNEPYYGICCDDQEPITHGWDTKTKELCGNYKIIGGNDQSPVWQTRWAGMGSLGGDLVRDAGFFMPPCTWHICGDDWWELVGKTLGNWEIHPEILSKHWCADWTGEAKDDTHHSSYRDFHGQVAQYHTWLQTDGNAILERLHGVFKSVPSNA